jgi:outer membrane usher protein
LTVPKILLILTIMFGSLAIPQLGQAQGADGPAPLAEDEAASENDSDKLFEQVFGRRQSGGQPALEVPLVVDGVDRGSISIETDDDPFATKLDREAFLDQVTDFLNEDGAQLLLELPDEDGKITAEALFDLGIMAEFDSADLVMKIEIDPELRKPLPLNLTNRGRAPRSLTEPLGPAPLSAYVNIRTGLDHVHETTGDGDTGTNPVKVDLAGAVALPRAAFDYRLSYNENSARPWQRGDLRVLQDFPDSAMRWTYGDLSFPTTNFQSFTPMGGVTMARNYALQPYVVTEPIASNEFVLRSPSQVEVLINGAVVRSFRLPAGRYDLRDLPLGSGVQRRRAAYHQRRWRS